MVSTNNGRSHGRGRTSWGGRISVDNLGNRRCEHCGRSNHMSDKCWVKFSKLEWAQQASADTYTSDTAKSKLIVIPPYEYEHYLQFQASQTFTIIASYASATGTSAYLAF